MRVFIRFEKSERLRFIGHLDLLRAMQRALSRSGLPVAYSQGFNPHMLISFASPLPVGLSGQGELADVTLSEVITEANCLAALRTSMPEGLPVTRVRIVPDNHHKLMAMLRTASYIIGFDSPEDAAPLLAAAPSFAEQESIPAIRVTKSGETPCDIRPMLHELTSAPPLNLLSARVSFTEANTLRPDLLVRALAEFAGTATPHFNAIRTGLHGGSEQRPVPLIDC